MKRTKPPSPAASASQGPSPAAAAQSHHEDGHLYDDEFLHNEDVAYEHTDVPIRELIMYTIGLALTCVVSALIAWGVFVVLERQAAKNDPQVSPLAVPAGELPPEPRLVTNEPAVLKRLRQTEAETLDQYGWVDKPGGTARIPIEDAKKRLLHEGLPVRADAAADKWLGTHSAARGESSGGRAIPLQKK